MHKKVIIIFISFLCFFSKSPCYVLAKDANFKLSILTKPVRTAIYQYDRVTKTLKIKPGMSILDIGAGKGLFTFSFADALQGTGRVFATDMDPHMVEYMKNKTEETGYKNVFPICVKSQEVDPFYKQHSFDLIFVSQVYQYLRDPEDYFRELRLSLKKKGSLYIIHSKNIFDFSEIEFDDFKKVIKALASKGDDYPVFQKLTKKNRDFIKNWQDKDILPEIRTDITRDFNKMLLDRGLLYELIDYYSAKDVSAEEDEWSSPLMFIVHPENLKLAKWLIVHLEASGVFRKKTKLTDEDKEQLHKLNRILLTNAFEIKGISEIQGEEGPIIYVEKNSVISTMKAAGYQLVREYDFLVYNYFLEFKRKY